MRSRFALWPAVVALVVTVATVGRADERGDALRLRDDGRILTAVGIGAASLGVGLIGIGFALPSCAFVLGAPEEGRCAFDAKTGNENAVTGLFFAGIGISVAGDALWIAGATLWSVGDRRFHRATAATRR